MNRLNSSPPLGFPIGILIVCLNVFAGHALVRGFAAEFAHPSGTELVEILMEAKSGSPPTGLVSKSGWPFAFSPTAPEKVKSPPPGSGVLYGEIPLVGRPALIAMVPSHQPGIPSTYYVDKNGDGDFSNDTPASYRGEGTYGSGGNLELEFKRADGTVFPYHVWIYSTINHPQGGGQTAFNYYSRTYKEGEFSICFGTVCKMIKISAGDPGNTGAFDTGNVYIDWNGNGKAEDSERLAENSPCKVEDKVVKVTKIHPFADKITLEISMAGPADLDTKNVMEELAKEPIKGNLPPDLESDLDGKPVKFEDYKGKVVLVDFWATWCGPCMKEMPNVKAAYEKFHEKGFDIIGVSLDKDFGKLKAFLSGEKIPWRQICDGKGWESAPAKRWHVDGIPATFLIGVDGKIAATGATGEMLLKIIEVELAKGR